MEIERKWLVSGWPSMPLPLLYEERQRQGYLHTQPPVVRIREETRGRAVKYVLCLKSDGRLAREEIEVEVAQEVFAKLERLIGLPLIEKVRRAYALPDGNRLEVNLVDAGLPSEMMYAEVEFPSVEEALAWAPEAAGLGAYLSREVTQEGNRSMAAHWARTRQAAVSSNDSAGIGRAK